MRPVPKLVHGPFVELGSGVAVEWRGSLMTGGTTSVLFFLFRRRVFFEDGVVDAVVVAPAAAGCRHHASDANSPVGRSTIAGLTPEPTAAGGIMSHRGSQRAPPTAEAERSADSLQMDAKREAEDAKSYPRPSAQGLGTLADVLGKLKK